MTLDEMRASFHALGADRQAVERTSYPARRIRDAMRDRVNQIERQMKPLTDMIKDIEAPLFDLDNTRARLSRALGGRTGAPPPSTAGQPLMSEADIIDVLKRLKIDVAVPVPTDQASATDPRIDDAIAAIRDLGDKINAMPQSADQSDAVKTLYADMKNFAEAVMQHDIKIAAIQQQNGEILSALKDFHASLKAS